MISFKFDPSRAPGSILSTALCAPALPDSTRRLCDVKIDRSDIYAYLGESLAVMRRRAAERKRLEDMRDHWLAVERFVKASELPRGKR